MINLLATRYRKVTAFSFFLLLYLELGLPAIANALYGEQHYFAKTHSTFSPTNPSLPTANYKKGEVSIQNEYKSPLDKKTVNIGGPGQPEMSSFKSVNANDMVDLFSGDFSYNIPLMDVGGYPINIHYNSGVSMDQESSWVGLGWNLNPGTISRNMRGLPDDFNGKDSITKEQFMQENKTVGVSVGGDVEVTGTPIGLGAKLGVFHNNYNGWGLENGINASINAGGKSYGPLSGSLSISNNSQTGLDVSPGISARFEKESGNWNGRATLGLSTNYNSRAGISGLQLHTEVRASKMFEKEGRDNDGIKGAGTSFPHTMGISFAVPSYTPTITMPVTNHQFSFTGKVGGEVWGVHGSVFVEGYVTTQSIKQKDRIKKQAAVGYLYFNKSANNPDLLIDFNREKELQFNYKSTPHIAIPQYTYDAFSISGEGTGGMFRAYRGDVGYVKDHKVITKSESTKGSIDLGFSPQIFHAGVDKYSTQAYTQTGGWESKNDLNKYIKFRDNDSNYQAVYFRNPGEKTTNSQEYYNSVGDDALVRVKLIGNGASIRATNALLTYKNLNQTGELPVSSPIVKKERDKRTQVISYLNADEARTYGLNRTIISYKENTIPVGSCLDTFSTTSRVDGEMRKAHHISQVSVLNGDGRNYVYGLPAYNIEQQDMTFAVDKENDQTDLNKGMADYTEGKDNSDKNDKGKDHFYTRETIPGYAHSFLLTGILSPDYVDIKGDGISDDDLGDAVKFNYSEVYSKDNPFQWRTPNDAGKANYNEGLKSYNRDDKGTILFGKKEVWYLNSVESKTMIAVFKISSDRKDVFSSSGVAGGIETSKPLRKLDAIQLYTKADLIKNGKKARPIKTVHFSYNYDLCKGGVPGNSSIGKLTLESIWFTYNGNDKGKLNPYVFRYHPDATGKPQAKYNPSYNPKHYDRWGNFKDPSFNPGGLNNADYPYAEQDSTRAADNAGTWNLTDIKLPSGGRIKVTYESDDYGYVQNKRATQFFQIAGISLTNSNSSGSALYIDEKSADPYYVFVNSPVSLKDKKDIFLKFLQGSNDFYFKLAVKVPTDRWGGGYEFIPTYARVIDYGLDPNNNTKFWVRLQSRENQSPLALAALQFLRLNLPSKAYPSSELGDNINVGDAVKMLASGFTEIKNAVRGFDQNARQKGWCKTIDLTKSFIRLNNPSLKKMGGGLRVKRVAIYDNWNKMTQQKESVYGQEYDYSTSIIENGDTVRISSGVASYEPMIGGEENPFRAPIEYAEKLAPLAPVSNLFSEYPLGESYYPSASVGYSKVRVRTINRKAKSANGWQETEYFTTKDFPTLVENTLLSDDAKKRHNPKLRNFLRINVTNQIYLSQGFKVELNDMNGRVKAQSSYAENDSLHPVSYVYNFYKVDDDKAFQKHLNNTVWVVDSVNGHLNPNGQIGKDIEVMVDMREQISRTIASNKSANLDAVPGGIIPFIPITTLIPLPQKEEVIFRSAATVKIVQRYGILDSVVVMDKGSVVSTKNMVYDAETGEVVLSRTENEFRDAVYNFSYPAHWAYSGMGMAYKNADAVFTNLNAINGKLYYRANNGTTPFPAEKFLESGDELQLEGERRLALSGEACLTLFPIFGLPDILKKLPERALAIDGAKGKEKNKGIYLIDENGKPVTGVVDKIRVLRSGKRNMLDASVGSIVAMANPIRQINSNQYKIVFDNTSRVINTSAVSYNDFWATGNSLYQADSCYTKRVDTTVVLYPQSSLLMREFSKNGNETTISPTANVLNDPHFTASLHNFRNCANISINCTRTKTYRTKSIIKFDFSSVPDNAQLTSATLDIYGFQIKGIWNRNDIDGLSWNGYDKAHYRRGGKLANRTNAAYLSNVFTPWNQNTGFNSVVTGSARADVSASPDATCDNKTVNVTSLINESLINRSRNYGIMIRLADDSHADKDEELRTLSFCTGFGSAAAAARLATNSSNTELSAAAVPAPTCDYCRPPALRISYYYQKDTCVKVCRVSISDTTVNPYRWGIHGNWRTEKSYTFYGDRKEGDATIKETDIRKEGELKSFTAYWKFTDSVLLQNADTTKWVWNSASSLYNKKGYEIENYDPLGRYNSGLYGYNQTLPVAVAQNSRYRELLFDGFEDYGYKTKNCTDCDPPKEIDFIKNSTGSDLTSIESHSGKYSLKVNSGTEAKLISPVTTIANNALPPALSIRVDSTPVYTKTVVGKGQGLTGSYSGYKASSCPVITPKTGKNFSATQIEGPIYFDWGAASPVSGMCNRYYDVTWSGKLQADRTDNYQFFASCGGVGVTVIVNNVTVVNAARATEISGPKISLQAGSLYNISIRYSVLLASNSFVHVSWMKESEGIKTVIPKSLMYAGAQPDTMGSVISNIKYYCIAANNPKPQQIFRPTFSPLQNSKMVASGWIKMGGNDCNTAPPLENVIVATIATPSGNTTIALQKTGIRIEGWQRYEAVFTVPPNATQFQLSVIGHGRTVYADDLRVQPYNSNMKSYVYDPVNLRLMAELDENNYTAFYEYDDDGTLIRVKKETEKGVMTIKETRSALLKD